MMWAITHEGSVCGFTSLFLDGSGSAEVGFGLARALWSRGLATEAATAVVAHGFSECALARIWAFADIRNEASWRVLEKIGMRREGVLRSRRVLHGERVDDVFYAVLREEWRSTESPPGR